jgi:hypothetical protein
MILKASFLAALLLGVYAAFSFGSIGHDEAALMTAPPLDSKTNPSPSGTDDRVVVNSAAKADRLPTVASLAEITTIAIEPAQLAQAPADGKTEVTKPPVTSWHWHAGSDKVTRK